jgi:hypothetical protein
MGPAAQHSVRNKLDGEWKNHDARFAVAYRRLVLGMNQDIGHDLYAFTESIQSVEAAGWFCHDLDAAERRTIRCRIVVASAAPATDFS